MIDRLLDSIADMDTKMKVLAGFFVFAILPAGLNLLILSRFSSDQILPAAGLYLVFLIIIQFPVCNLGSNLLVLRNIAKINSYCRKIKMGIYHEDFELLPEKGEENDFIRAKRNLYWMGRAIGIREEKLEAALKELNIAQDKLMQSIQYASRIQQAVLPPEPLIREVFGDYFIWWEPRDVVGGDTYWVTPACNGYFVAAIDCTGHGVPGAFMTLIVHALLEQCLRSDGGDDPALVLEQMNRRLTRFLHGRDTPNRIDDGFEAAVCHIGTNKKRLVFAGAGLPLYCRSNGGIMEIKGDRRGVGDARAPRKMRYNNHTIEVSEQTCFYLVTDGLIDQIGGAKRLPFGKKRLKDILGRVTAMPFEQQQEKIMTAWRDWADNEEKRDDLTVLGFSLGQH